MKNWLVIAASLLAFSLSGCNTFSGMGKDLQEGGQAITKAADDSSSSSSKNKSSQ